MRNLIIKTAFLAGLACYSAAEEVRAEKIDETKFNSPQIVSSVGKGPTKNAVGIKIPQAPLVIRSAPVETDVELTYKSAFKNAIVVMRCRTPCLFKVPSFAEISLRPSVPNGYSISFSPIKPTWEQGWTNHLKPNEVLFFWNKN